jgi:hypothetical protein
MAGTGRKKADDALLTALAAGATIQEAAGRAGLSERTAYRRMAEGAFAEKLKRFRADMLQRALGRLADTSTKAVETLSELLLAKSETVRLGAARSILELATRFRESVEFDQRLAELERRT